MYIAEYTGILAGKKFAHALHRMRLNRVALQLRGSFHINVMFRTT